MQPAKECIVIVSAARPVPPRLRGHRAALRAGVRRRRDRGPRLDLQEVPHRHDGARPEALPDGLLEHPRRADGCPLRGRLRCLVQCHHHRLERLGQAEVHLPGGENDVRLSLVHPIFHTKFGWH